MGSGLKKVAVLLGDPSLEDHVKLGARFNDEDIDTVERLKKALGSLNGYEFFYLNSHKTLFEDILKIPIDYVLNFCDEGYMNDPHKEADVPEFLENQNILYTGAASECLRTCFDKSLVKNLAQFNGVNTAEFFVVKENAEITEQGFGYPAIVKPNFGDGSFAINRKSVVRSYGELKNQVEYVREQMKKAKHKNISVLIEQYLPGNEITAAIIGNTPYLEAHLIEEDFSVIPKGYNKIISNEAKWDPTAPEWNLVSIKPTIPEDSQRTILKHSANLFRIFECGDYARFDWRLDSRGIPHLLEANPNCGWCWDGHLAKAFNLNGCDYSSMLQKILAAAEKRFKSNNS
jgi:D-alanine-D-alanine ligase